MTRRRTDLRQPEQPHLYEEHEGLSCLLVDGQDAGAARRAYLRAHTTRMQQREVEAARAMVAGVLPGSQAAQLVRHKRGRGRG